MNELVTKEIEDSIVKDRTEGLTREKILAKYPELDNSMSSLMSILRKNGLVGIRKKDARLFGMRIIGSEKITLNVDKNLLNKIEEYSKRKNTNVEEILLNGLNKLVVEMLQNV